MLLTQLSEFSDVPEMTDIPVRLTLDVLYQSAGDDVVCWGTSLEQD